MSIVSDTRSAYKMILARVGMFKGLEDSVTPLIAALSSDWVITIGTGPSSFSVQTGLGHLLHVAWGNY